MRKFSAFMLRLLGWKAVGGPAPEKICVILGVPHTCIADFIVSFFFYKSLGHTAHIMIKKEFFFWPVGPLLRALGCIPVDRSNGATVVRSVISAAEAAIGEFHICVAPEGTRKAVKRWKMGYHTIARALDCPVYLGYFDWRTKCVSIGERFDCSDDARGDTERIQALYEDMRLTARHPEKYRTK